MSRNRLPLLVAVLALVQGPALREARALEATIERLAFLPATYGSGETVEAVAQLRLSGEARPEAFTLKVGAGLPEPGSRADPELRAVSLRRSGPGWELRVQFLPWSPGKGAIPPLEAGGLSIPRIPYEALSLTLPTDRELAPPAPQREPRGAALALYGLSGFVLLLAAGGAAAAVRLVPAARALLARRRAAQAARAFERDLRYLGRGIDPAEGAAFYAALARGLRLYLRDRVLEPAPALTPRELRALPEADFPAPGLRDEAAAILGEADAVRFAGLEPTAASMRAALDRAAAVAGRAEEALDARA